MSLLLSTSIDSDSLRSWADEKSLNIFLQERKKNNKNFKISQFFYLWKLHQKALQDYGIIHAWCHQIYQKQVLDCLCFYNFEYMFKYRFHKAHSWYMFQIYLLFRMKHFQWPIMYRILNRCCQYTYFTKYHQNTWFYMDEQSYIQMKSNIFHYHWVKLFNILACLLMHNQLKTLD